MTEEFIRQICGDGVHMESAGIAPGSINPVVAQLLTEDGIDIAGKKTQGVHDLHATANSFDYGIAVCDPEAAQKCPAFPAEKKRFHLAFPDPPIAAGTMKETLASIRRIRDLIPSRVVVFCGEEGLS